MALYDFTLSPIDRLINEGLLIDEINTAYPTYNITNAIRNSGIIYLETDEILDAGEQSNITTLITAHIPTQISDTTSGIGFGPENPIVCDDDPRLSYLSTLQDNGFAVDESGNGTVIGHLKFKFYSQEIVPTLGDGEAAWWHRPSVDETYLLIKVPGAGQKLVELK